MIDWNNNGKFDPVDVGISIAVSQDEESEENMVVSQKAPSLFELLKRWFGSKPQ